MDKTQLLESLKREGFSKQILDAFSKVNREDFITDQFKHRTYSDTALPIGEGQTISQPYTIATMLSLLDLKKAQKVLELGSGSGYVLALLSEIVGKDGQVFGVERIKQLSDNSKKPLKEYSNVQVFHTDGSKGLEKNDPYDRIIISAACDKIPKTILNQLKHDGILVAPIGKPEQSLIKLQRKNNKFVVKKEIPGFVFVPFIDSNN